MTFGSLFSGIGGIDLGLERAGMECKWQVEIDPFCRKVLAKHWPNVARYEDVKKVHGALAHTCLYCLEPVDVIAGGFPCQDVSVAGKRKGIKEGTRSGLWFEYHRIICELRPRYVIVENVPGLFVNGMGIVLGDLAEIGYNAEWEVLSAADMGAPHLRKRVFIMAYPDNQRLQGHKGESTELNQANGRSSANGQTGLCRETLANPISNATGATYRSSGRDSEQRWDDESVGQRDTVGSHTGDGSAEVADARSQRLQGTKFRYDNDAEAGRGKTGTTGAAAECCGNEGGHWAVEPDVGRVAHGVPRRVDRLKGLGNAVVPQCAEWVGRRIMEMGK